MSGMNQETDQMSQTENLDRFTKTTTNPIAGLLKTVESVAATLPDNRGPVSRSLECFKGSISALLRDESKFAQISADCQQTLLEIISGPLANLMEKWSPQGTVHTILKSVDPESVTAADPLVSDSYRAIFKH